jgi:hypothetical protein
MKRYLLVMPVILATTAAIADTAAIAPSSRADAHAQAAALLSGVRHGSQVRTIARVVEPSGARPSPDAHAQAAALLSGSRGSTHLEAERAQGGAFTSGKVP